MKNRINSIFGCVFVKYVSLFTRHLYARESSNKSPNFVESLLALLISVDIALYPKKPALINNSNVYFYRFINVCFVSSKIKEKKNISPPNI